jgi:hypothetical protein
MKGARQMPGVLVKMPPDLKKSLSDVAQPSFRSLNAEIVMRLSKCLAAEKENAPSAATGEAL